MGRKSRHKRERRLGQVQPTPKEAERAIVKAERRTRDIAPTVEAYTRVAASGPAQLAAALINRHTTRIDNLDAVAQRCMDHCVAHLLAISALDAALLGGSRQLWYSPPHESRWPTHLSWSLESTIAALRLMLAGQTVGAAIILRQQLGRWTLLLARAHPVVQRRYESIESFIARAWTRSAIDMLGQCTAAVGADDIFDDIDTHPPTTGVIRTDHEHVQLGERAVCPAHVYHELCQLIDGQPPELPTECEVVHDLDATDSPTRALCDALSLCLMHMRLAAPRRGAAPPDPDTARALGSLWAPERPPAVRAATPSVPLCTSPLHRPTAALVPLVRTELASSTNINELFQRYTDYHAVLADRSRAEHPTPRELAELAFAAHRYIRFAITEHSHALDLNISQGRLGIRHHLGPRSAQILTAEFAALCAHWNQSRPHIAAAATQISATLLSGYWLWLEEDDRAMGILRCTLHHAARMRLWHTNPDAAQELQTIPSTTPRRWRNVAGWSQHRSLDFSLYDYAHANRESRIDAPALLFRDDDHYADDWLPQRQAREVALDKVTTLAATEIMKVVDTHQSRTIANTMREALHNSGLDLQTSPARRQPEGRTTPPGTAHDTTATPDTPLFD
ncbi:hypothetical protein X425_01498 [Mycobacterium rhizamassiliense]|uniref:Uncharacterized protein n=2 Tax=Mycobacterium rhizamassiliense TaxID=1841860 RepID=A0A2U3NTF0_9MYCO|nr:hypothetical protein X425_01498 [Mycobacterium rhizamassiliense]